jgi:hypothetical protein
VPREGWAQRQIYNSELRQWEVVRVGEDSFLNIATWAAKKLKGKLTPMEADQFMEHFMTELGFEVVAHVRCPKKHISGRQCELPIAHNPRGEHYHSAQGTWHSA